MRNHSSNNHLGNPGTSTSRARATVIGKDLSDSEKEHIKDSVKGDAEPSDLHSDGNREAAADNKKSAADRQKPKHVADNKGAVEQERDSTWRNYAGYERANSTTAADAKIPEEITDAEKGG